MAVLSAVPPFQVDTLCIIILLGIIGVMINNSNPGIGRMVLILLHVLVAEILMIGQAIGQENERNERNESNIEQEVEARTEFAFLERYFDKVKVPEFLVFTREAVMGVDPTRPPAVGEETVAAYRGIDGEFRISRQGLPSGEMTALDYLTQTEGEGTKHVQVEGKLFLIEQDIRRVFYRHGSMVREVPNTSDRPLPRFPHNEFRQRFKEILKADKEGTLRVCEPFSWRVPKWDQLLKTHAASSEDFLYFSYSEKVNPRVWLVAMRIEGPRAGSMTIFGESERAEKLGESDKRLLHRCTILLENLVNSDGVTSYQILRGSVGDHKVSEKYEIHYLRDFPGGDSVLEKFSLGEDVEVVQLEQESSFVPSDMEANSG